MNIYNIIIYADFASNIKLVYIIISFIQVTARNRMWWLAV